MKKVHPTSDRKWCVRRPTTGQITDVRMRCYDPTFTRKYDMSDINCWHLFGLINNNPRYFRLQMNNTLSQCLHTSYRLHEYVRFLPQPMLQICEGYWLSCFLQQIKQPLNAYRTCRVQTWGDAAGLRYTHRGSWCVRRAQILLDAFHCEACDASSRKTKLSQ